MVSPSGKVVETGRAQLAVDLSSLAEADNFELYEHLTSFRVLDFDEKDLDEEIDRIENDIPPPPPSEHVPTRSVRLSSWAWHSKNRLILKGNDGTSALISNGKVESVMPPDGVITFDGTTNQSSAAGAARYKPTLAQRGLEKCIDLECPLAQCVVRTSRYNIQEIQCAGSPVWTWPDGVEISAANPTPQGRQLTHGVPHSTPDVCTTRTCCDNKRNTCVRRCTTNAVGRGMRRRMNIQACVADTAGNPDACDNQWLTCFYPNGCCTSIVDG